MTTSRKVRAADAAARSTCCLAPWFGASGSLAEVRSGGRSSNLWNYRPCNRVFCQAEITKPDGADRTLRIPVLRGNARSDAMNSIKLRVMAQVLPFLLLAPGVVLAQTHTAPTRGE